MKETEIEVEEREVERVYCDKCGDECTDDHRIEPSEVCPSCSSETAVDRVTDLLAMEEDSDEQPSIPELLFFAAIFPLVVIPIFTIAPSDDSDDAPTMEDLKLMAFFMVGSITWTSLLFVIFVL